MPRCHCTLDSCPQIIGDTRWEISSGWLAWNLRRRSSRSPCTIAKARVSGPLVSGKYIAFKRVWKGVRTG